MTKTAPHKNLPDQRATLIAVIADDFTGAAEIGGIAIRYGFKTLISTFVDPKHHAEVLIIATDTRSEDPQNARKTIKKITSQLLELQPGFIFKKIDSVLRGNVADELFEQLQVSKKKRTLVIPANPSLNRVIKNGIYYLDGKPLDRQSFTTETKVPGSANVIELLGNEFANRINIVSKEDDLPLTDLIIGNTVSEEDLNYWAGLLDEETIFAGGSSFFNAILKKRKAKANVKEFEPQLGNFQLYVCGSAFAASRKFVFDIKNRKQVVYMPVDLFCDEVDYSKAIKIWKSEIVDNLCNSGATLIAVNKLACSPKDSLPEKISIAFADVVKSILHEIEVNELLIEGGHTALTIVEKLKYHQFVPVEEFATGVIRMKAIGDDDLYLTLKPGSYKWPNAILDQINQIEPKQSQI